ncbi:tetratricopeptide repeat protein [Massilia sp. Dwa41.01b]|uniref:tetratricopeptide repeat protein n=1 Tax=Massilia sp. Dwa41.01b TaxID=2709302 RepID=UPI001602A8DF|nr:tetratricopeptide repeat protein [Massilia sp. Dwa41.01b]QNA90635.1 tetratricopeptide repeat protein [Massilia sp. Dwa41.01b]
MLVVHPGSAGLDGIAYPPAPERQRRSEQVTVTAMDAPASLLVRSEYSGAGAETLRANSAMATQAEMKKSLGDAMARRYPEAQLVGDVVLRDDRERNVMVLESQFTVPRMFSESATAWTVDYNAVNMADLLQVPGAGQRSAPLTVPGYPYAVDYEMTLRLPESFAMREDSESRTVADPAFNGTRKITLGKRGLKLELQLNLLADRIEAARTVEFSRKLQAWDMQRAGTLRVFKADMQGTPVAPPNEEARQRAALVKLDQAVQDAERSGREPGRALCERARVRAHLGQAQDAIKDATRAVKLQDQADGLLACRAEVYLLTGRVAEAKADFTRVIARGQGEPATWFGRGLANLYLNQPTQALADFREAGRATDEGERLSATVMQASLGTAPAAPGSVEDGENAWLPVALDMFAGRATPEHMLSIVARGRAPAPMHA